MFKHPVMIIDCANVFIRAYVAYPSMTVDGDQIGGCVGFLKSMIRLVREYKPCEVYLVWESGGSTKRRALYKEYKEGRRPVKMNRYYEDDIPDTDENRKWQLESLIKLLDHLPVCQLYVPDCEGDDVIAYLCKYVFLDEEKVIVSSDRDMYQLLDEKTVAYDLHSKKIVTAEDVFEKFRVKTCNFALAKALMGDASDNIPGIKGMGPKSVCKLYPQLGTDVRVLVQDIVDYSSAHSDESRLYARVCENVDVLKRNWRLVCLDSLILSQIQMDMIKNLVDAFEPTSNKLTLFREMRTLGIDHINVDDYLTELKYLSSPVIV